ncbi:hypothetical protein P4O66_006048, partial [Electrophorus voltai]
MDRLQHEGGELEWKESARWVKFEEKVEQGGERWSKPHVSTLSLHSLFELRTCLQTSSVVLGLEAHSLPQIVDEIVEKQVQDGLIAPQLKEKITFVLLRKHRHHTKKSIHRSLADIGKPSPSNKGLAWTCCGCLFSWTENSPYAATIRNDVCIICISDHDQSHSMDDISVTPTTEQLKNKFMKKLPRDAEASNVLIGEVDFLEKPFVAFVRLAQATTLGGLTEVPMPSRFLFVLLGPPGKAKSYSEIGRSIATLMVDDLFSSVAYKARGCEDLIAGIDEFLNEVTVLPPGEWDPKIRIEPPKKVPSAEMRKSFFTLNESGQANRSAGGVGLAAANDEEMPPSHKLGEELTFTGSFCGGLCFVYVTDSVVVSVYVTDFVMVFVYVTDSVMVFVYVTDSVVVFVFCGGLCLDVKRKLPWLLSDFYEGFHAQCISAVLFIYLGCVTNAITFGGLLGDATDNYQGVMESFLGTALAGTVFCLLGGQPLIILSSTGPILVFEKLLFEFCKNNDIDYLELRLWIGLHSCLQCLVLVSSDASYVIKYMTRFTEEGFSSLISFIFIFDAIKKMVGAFQNYPINTYFTPDSITAYKCECRGPGQVTSVVLNSSSLVVRDNLTAYSLYNATGMDWSQLSKKDCLKYGGALVGKSCNYIADLALMSFILFFGTYTMTISLKKFKSSQYFPTKFRTFIADFSIIISILVFCGLDFLVSLDTPKLHVPSEIKVARLSYSVIIPTRPDRSWVVLPFGKSPWWIYLASFVPALLVTILIFMDQQITAVIINRKENKLKKGCGYHLDLFWVGLLMAACSFLGLPWYVAATVISIAHIDSLKMESESSAPGEQPQFLGVREQRLTGILVFVLTGVSIFLAPILQYIPMPVLYGVFLYMGVSSLSGIQFWERIKLFLMPAKHQPDFVFLRHVPLRRVYLFTLVQITCLVVLWTLKSTVAAIIFPVMILGLMVVRKILDLVFSQHDLAWLDDILPDKDKKKKEDEKREKKKTKGRDCDDDEEVCRHASPKHNNTLTLFDTILIVEMSQKEFLLSEDPYGT